MLKNYILVALRNFRRHKTSSIINVIGLSTATASCLLILLFIMTELSYDTYHTNADRVFRIIHERNLNGTFEKTPMAPLALAPALQADYPQIEHAARILREFSPVIEFEQNQFIEERVFFADPSIFDIFDFKLARGDPATALADPNSIVISKEISKKYFGGRDPIGKLLTYRKWGQNYEFAVTGILNDVRDNSHFKVDFLIPFESQQNLWNQMHGKDWFYAGAWTYILLSETDAASDLERKLPEFVQRNFPASLKSGTTLSLQPLTRIHLYSHLDNEIEANGNISDIYIFSSIAILILCIACINFMNLTTAKSAVRSKEVGIRKVLGAERSVIIKQFLGEALFFSIFSVLFASMVVALFLPGFGILAQRNFELGVGDLPWIIPVLCLAAVIVGVLAGSYPAFYLSGFVPVRVMQGFQGQGGMSLRKGLVIVQFVISMILLMGIGIISDQIAYMKNKEFGFNQEEILFLRSQPSIDFSAFKTELSKGPGVQDVVGAGNVPGSENASAISWRLFRPENMVGNQRMQLASTSIDHGYDRLFGLNLLDGRLFSPDFPTDDQDAVILNESAVKEFGWSKSPVGKKIEVFNMIGESSGMRTVVGVVKDYNFESLHHPIKPIVLFNRGSRRYSHFVLKINPINLTNTIAYVERIWKDFAPQFPLELFFLDQDISNLYRREERLSQTLQYFTILAIVVACLGLFGLSTFMAEQRTKEIGVRKVMGATASNIVTLLSKEYTQLVLAAFIIASPIAYLFMNRWLDNFAFRIEINVFMLFMYGIAVLLIALITVGYHSIRSALANPVDSLRYE